MTRFTVTFLLLGAFCVVNGVTAGQLVRAVLWLNVGLSSLVVGISYGLRTERLFLKRRNGSIGPFGWALNWPYFLLNFLTLYLYKWFGSEAPVTEIIPGLYLGRRLSGRELAIANDLSINTTLDLTAEFSEPGFLRKSGYLNIPILDYNAPDAEQLDAGIEWIAQGLKKGGVLVHCALGHGRSATFVVAFLVDRGKAISLDEAIGMVSERRPGVRLSDIQRQALEAYLGRPPKRLVPGARRATM